MQVGSVEHVIDKQLLVLWVILWYIHGMGKYVWDVDRSARPIYANFGTTATCKAWFVLQWQRLRQLRSLENVRTLPTTLRSPMFADGDLYVCDTRDHSIKSTCAPRRAPSDRRCASQRGESLAASA